MSIEQHPLPYLKSGEGLASELQHLPWFGWLDSGRPEGAFGRYDIFVAEPSATLASRCGVSEWRTGDESRTLEGDPLEHLQALLRQRRVPRQALPFCGGALGYLSYDLGHRLEGLADDRPPARAPELAVGFYDWAVVTDHERQETFWTGRRAARPVLTQLLQHVERSLDEHPFRVASALHDDMDRNAHAQAFARVQAYLRAGDSYQVNLARRLSIAYEGNPWCAYQLLRKLTPVPFGAYLALPFASVLSLSPERFISMKNGAVETRPIKGTRPRRADTAQDRREREALLASPKDRAENVMIVDLLRNDLGRVCLPGSITVPELCKLESYPSVHHLVSTIRGELAPGRDAVDLLRACLPGGSITGAPKRRAMEIIAELEPRRRGVYCGAIGYISDDGGMDTNVAIRTAQCVDGEMSFWVGGGLVVDSIADEEFQETLDKAAPFLALLEALGQRSC